MKCRLISTVECLFLSESLCSVMNIFGKMPEISRISLCILVLSLLASAVCVGQQPVYLPFYTADTGSLYSLALSHRQSLKNAFIVPEEANKEYRKNFLALTDGLSENIYATIRYRALLDTLINPYVQEVFQKVVAKNRELPPARLILVRSPIENAFALGDGTILVNIGLLSKLENESQLAFVLCHELAHIYFQHMQKGVKDYFNVFYNKKFRKEYRKIVKEEYNMYTRLNSLVQNASLNNLYHKRANEQQADSLGYVLLSKTDYDLSQAYAALQLLDRIDEPYSSEEIALENHFGCSQVNHLFRKKSEKASSIFAIEPEKPKAFELSDTLKTHPGCEKRMQYIQTLSGGHPREKKGSGIKPGQFQRIKSISRIEVIQSWYDAGRYDRTLFETLLLMQKEPGNSYLHSMAMLCLFELKKHMENHLYADVVARVADYYPGNLNQFLENLHRLNLSDFEQLANCFHALHPPADKANEYSLAATFAYHRLMNEQAMADEAEEKYRKKHAQGRLEATLFD